MFLRCRGQIPWRQLGSLLFSSGGAGGVGDGVSDSTVSSGVALTVSSGGAGGVDASVLALTGALTVSSGGSALTGALTVP